MIVLRSVLTATDFSEPANRALDYAKGIAESFGAVLHIVHVAADVMLEDPMLTASSLEEIRESADSALAKIDERITADERGRLGVRTAVLQGEPHDAILAYADEHKIELIVLGTHGRGAIEQFILGSVAERIVRHAKCPVLTVKADEA
jgi:nucleotide-binding universal stress UspA family protein